jgi:cytoskeletal protein CcmA (bactofilin family)
MKLDDWADESTMSFEAVSLVDRHSAFDGTLRSQRDLRVEGELKGNVSCEGTLFVAEGASVAATVDAEHITVAGDLTGEVRCRGRLQILASGRVRAQVAVGSLVIHEGAIYEGQLQMTGVDVKAPLPLRSRPGPTSLEAVMSEKQPGNTTFIRRLGNPETPWSSPPQDEASGEVAVADEPVGPAG